MKKFISSILILLLIIPLSSCEKNQKITRSDKDNYIFAYKIKGAVSFTISNDNNIWVLDDSGIVSEYDKNGNKNDRRKLGSGEHTDLNLCGNDLIYFSYTNEGQKIQEYDLKTDKKTSYKLPEEVTGAVSMAVTDKNIYLICWNLDHNSENDYTVQDDGYSNLGETAVIINRKTHKSSKMNIKNPVALYQISDGQIMFCFHNGKEGYCTSVYNEKNKTFSVKKKIAFNGYIFAFAYDKDDDLLITTEQKNRRLIALNASDNGNGSEAQLMNDIFASTGNDIKYRDGFCYVLNDISKDIIRVDIKTAINGSKEKKLTMYRTMNMADPYGCGYFINSRTLKEDAFALSVMAGDKDFDLYMVDTQEEKAKEIRDRGAFYPLNKVSGVKEYLNSCHDYIKAAAYDDNGDIWMIPVSVDIPFLLYNDRNMTSAGTGVSDIDDLSDMLDTADKLFDDKSLREWYSINGYQLQQIMIDSYNAAEIKNRKAEYNTNEFKVLSELFKKHSPDNDESLHTWIKDISSFSDDHEGYYDRYMISLSHYYEISLYDTVLFKKLNATAVPGISGISARNYGTCVCLCVNPASQRRDAALDYISSFCRFMTGSSDNWMYKDQEKIPFPKSSLSKDIHDIYKNGDICFELPHDIFWNSYFKFQQGQTSFIDMAKDLNRKVDTYLNE